jgi:hypothetical protein
LCARHYSPIFIVTYVDCVHFQLVMLAYNLYCWLPIRHRDGQAQRLCPKLSERAIQTRTKRSKATGRFPFVFLCLVVWLCTASRPELRYKPEGRQFESPPGAPRISPLCANARRVIRQLFCEVVVFHLYSGLRCRDSGPVGGDVCRWFSPTRSSVGTAELLPGIGLGNRAAFLEGRKLPRTFVI